MKVLFIVNSLRFGGAEKHVVTLLNELDVRRFDLSLVYLKNETALLQQLRSERLSGGVWCAGVRRKLDWPAMRRLGQEIDHQQYDLIVCTNGYALAYGTIARWWSRRRPPLIEVLHTTELAGIKAKLQMAIYRPFFYLSNLLVFVCHTQRLHWRRRLLVARHNAVVHNGIDTDYFRDSYSVADKQRLRTEYGLGEQDFVVGLCAVMRPEKAHGDLLKAIAALRTRGIPVKALLIGDGVERAAIEQHIAQLDLGEAVKISGFAADVRPLIAICDVMALVSHHVETFSIAALESMAMGKPMVMSRIGGAVEQVRHGLNGYLYERGDIAALSDSIGLLMQGGHCHEMGLQARQLVLDQFSLGGMIARFAALFEQYSGQKSHDN